MPAGRPWYQRNPTDFIVGTIGWDLELRGAYSLLIDILNERDRPIPDDARFVAGFLGVSTRKWGQLRDRLLDSGKIILTDDGCLSNPRFERERAERRQAHDRAVEAGRQGGRKSAAMRAAGQGDLDLETDPAEGGRADYLAENAAKTPRKRDENGAKVKDNPEITDQEPRNSAVSDQPPPQATRARDRSEIRGKSIEEDSNQTSNPTSASVADDRSIDVPLDREALLDIVRSVARVGGVVLRPERPDGFIRFNVDIVRAWITDGISIEKTALPAIAARVARSDDTIGSIKAYDADVRKAHARTLNGAAEPAEPMSPERFVEMRRTTVSLYRRMGRHAEADEIEATLPPLDQGG